MKKNIDKKQEKYIKDSKVEIREISASKVLEEVLDAHKRKGSTCLIITQDSPVCYVGKDEYNKKYCEENNIPVYQIGYSGGTIIAGKDDLTLGIVLNSPSRMNYFQDKLGNWINDNFVNGKFVGNDFIIDGHKVVGTARRKTGGKTLYCIQVSFSVDLELIEKICLKPMIKKPKGLSNFGDKTNKDLISEIKLWL